LHVEELAKTIDHTLLRADTTAADIDQLCSDAAHHHFAAVCVFPHFVPQAAGYLKKCDVKVCTVISFPYGADTAQAKLASAVEAVTRGADELDVVMNIPAMISGDFGYVRNELLSVVRAVRMKSVNSGKGHTLIKVIIETCYLTNKMKRMACKIVEQTGADFIKTSTGCGPRGAVVQDVELLRDCLDEHVGVKASGGIRTLREVELMINAGAARIGTSSGVEIMQEFITAHTKGVVS